MEWISVKESLPPVMTQVLVWGKPFGYPKALMQLGVSRIEFSTGSWGHKTHELVNVSHWMQLPEPALSPPPKPHTPDAS